MIMDKILELHTTEEVMEAIENSDKPYLVCRPINTWVGLRILRLGYNIDDDYEDLWIISTKKDDEVKSQYKFFFHTDVI